MNITRFAVSVALTGALCASLGYAQAPSPSPSTTSPSSASSPQQRDSTHSNANETPATSGTDPADASSPHQRLATADSSPQAKQKMMKDCMSQQAAKTPDMSKSDMTKACNDQMKMQKDHASMSKAPANAPKDTNSSAESPK